MHSGWAEAFGVLAALLFLRHYIQSYVSHLFSKSTIQCYCDNQGVVTTASDMRNATLIRPNDTTNDDRDVYLAIYEASSQCAPINIQFLHVKGHQDSKSNKPLTTIEQFNVDCNSRAKQYVTNSPIASTSFPTPAIPVAQPHLRIHGKLICRKFIPTLRYTMSTPPYDQYLQQRFQWTPSDTTKIHWTVLQRSLDSFNANDQRHLVLFLNDKLPLRASKAHPHNGSPLCPSCQREPETAHHFLTCTNPARKTVFSNLKIHLTEATQKLRMHPCILSTLWLGLASVRYDTPYPDILMDVLPQLCAPIHHQARLGWTQLYQGRISNRWAKAIDATHPEFALSGEQIMTQLLQIIWTSTLETWKVRNEHLHRNSDQLNLPNYRQAIITLYDQHHQLPPDAQAALYRQPLETLLEQPPPDCKPGPNAA